MIVTGAQKNRAGGSRSPGVAMLAEAGTREAMLTDIDLDPLVFDPDAQRRGQFGGFFLANDAGAEKYEVPRAPRGAEWARRYNGPGKVIPGTHLPRLVRFAIVAAGPLMKISKAGRAPQFRFEAIVFCDQVIDRQTSKFAMLRLAINGVPAVKLHKFMALEINEPLRRLTDRLHKEARDAYRDKTISRSRFEAALSRAATPQFIWVPVKVKACQRLGGEGSETRGALPFVEVKGKKSDRLFSMWSHVSTDKLAMPDSEGGLLLTGWVREECFNLHQRFHRVLHERALWKENNTRSLILSERPKDDGAPARVAEQGSDD